MVSPLKKLKQWKEEAELLLLLWIVYQLSKFLGEDPEQRVNKGVWAYARRKGLSDERRIALYKLVMKYFKKVSPSTSG